MDVVINLVVVVAVPNVIGIVVGANAVIHVVEHIAIAEEF